MKNSSRNYSVVVAWDAGSRKYIASCLEVPACAAASADRMEAIRLAYRAVDQHVAYRRKLGLGSPTPMRRSHSGKVLVRTSGALHKALSERALLEGISLNQYVCLILTRGVVANALLSDVEERINGLAARFETALATARHSRCLRTGGTKREKQRAVRRIQRRRTDRHAAPDRGRRTPDRERA
jgi:predicted HicB family RNase H-like nuclease